MPSNKDNMPDNKDLEQLRKDFDEMGNNFDNIGDYFENINKNLDIKNITIEVDSMYCITPGCECGRELLPHDAERVADVTITFEVVIKNLEGVEKSFNLDIVVSIGSTFNETINNPLTVSDTMDPKARQQWKIFANWLDQTSSLLFTYILIEAAKDVGKDITDTLKSKFQANNKPAKETMH